jgi:hypothetical protein
MKTPPPKRKRRASDDAAPSPAATRLLSKTTSEKEIVERLQTVLHEIDRDRQLQFPLECPLQ